MKTPTLVLCFFQLLTASLLITFSLFSAAALRAQAITDQQIEDVASAAFRVDSKKAECSFAPELAAVAVFYNRLTKIQKDVYDWALAESSDANMFAFDTLEKVTPTCEDLKNKLNVALKAAGG